MRVGDDRSVQVLETREVELLQDQWHVVAGMDLVEPLPRLAPRADRQELEVRMAPDEAGRQPP
jgi:hypothetical protein